MPNLIGHSTTEKLVSDAAPLLRGVVILEPVTINTTQHRRRTTYLIVILSTLGVAAKPTHGDDL